MMLVGNSRLQIEVGNKIEFRSENILFCLEIFMFGVLVRHLHLNQRQDFSFVFRPIRMNKRNYLFFQIRLYFRIFRDLLRKPCRIKNRVMCSILILNTHASGAHANSL